MIRCIAAIDSKRGIANAGGIPWQGKIPSDSKWFRKNTIGGSVLMGYSTFAEFSAPLPGRMNYVVSHHRGIELPSEAKLVQNVDDFIKEFDGDLWIIGGAAVFEQTLDLADELYITQLQGEYGCTKFFPAFESIFERVNALEPITENGITFRYQIWKRMVPKATKLVN